MNRLADQHARFVRFLAVRVGDRAAAEDILHSAYVKALEREHQLRADESIVAWFYRILHNSLIDYYRRSAARDRAHQRYAAEVPDSYEHELQEQSCACVGDLVSGLKSEYREAIERIDLREESVEDLPATRESLRTTPRFVFTGPARLWRANLYKSAVSA